MTDPRPRRGGRPGSRSRIWPGSCEPAGNWPADRAITDVRRHGPSITVSGHGVARVLAVSTVRSDVNAWAHCLQPGRYPGLGRRVPGCL